MASGSRSVRCPQPNCGLDAEELFQCRKLGCEYNIKGGCKYHFRGSYLDKSCANGHKAEKVWP